jgi:hypothetical protein
MRFSEAWSEGCEGMIGAKNVFVILSGTGLRLEPSIMAKLTMRGTVFVPVLSDAEEKDTGCVWYEAGVITNEDGRIEGIYAKACIYDEKNDHIRDIYYAGAVVPLPSITVAAELEPWEYMFWRGAPRIRVVEIPILPAKTAEEILEEMKRHVERHPYLSLLPNGKELKW